jgi:hypothetical protein
MKFLYPEPRGPRVLPVGELVLWYGMFGPLWACLGNHELCPWGSIDQECVDKKGLILVEIKEINKRSRGLASLLEPGKSTPCRYGPYSVDYSNPVVKILS